METLKVALITILVFGMGALVYAQDGGSLRSKKSVSSGEAGAGLFNDNCRRCHPNGDNVVVPDLPLRGSAKLADFRTFLSFIRNPGMHDGSEGVMPAFSGKQISDQDARVLYDYIISAGGAETLGRSDGMGRGMMGGGYGMGRGMMGGGYGMGHGMMGGYFQSEECQKFLDETAGLRKHLHEKRFEYAEAYRNPRTTPENLVKIEREILALQKKIYADAPLGCAW